MKKGKLIILEGIDGSGKTTQFKRIIKHFEDNKIPFSVYDFPRYYDNFWGETAGKMLSGKLGNIQNISPYLKSMFFLLDQSEAGKSIEKDLEEGKTVICNRYATSQVYQLAMFSSQQEKDSFWNWFEKAAYEKLSIIKPDFILVFAVDPDIAFKNVDNKNNRDYLQDKKRDLNESDLQLQINVNSELIKKTEEFTNWIRINVSEGDMMKKE